MQVIYTVTGPTSDIAELSNEYISYNNFVRMSCCAHGYYSVNGKMPGTIRKIRSDEFTVSQMMLQDYN